VLFGFSPPFRTPSESAGWFYPTSILPPWPELRLVDSACPFVFWIGPCLERLLVLHFNVRVRMRAEVTRNLPLFLRMSNY